MKNSWWHLPCLNLEHLVRIFEDCSSTSAASQAVLAFDVAFVSCNVVLKFVFVFSLMFYMVIVSMPVLDLFPV